MLHNYSWLLYYVQFKSLEGKQTATERKMHTSANLKGYGNELLTYVYINVDNSLLELLREYQCEHCEGN